MKNILIILILIINIHCYGQSKMTINQTIKKLYTSHRGPITKIDSFSELPSAIQINTNGFLKKILGSMSDSVQFSHGQEVNLKAILKKDSITFNSFRVRPKYNLSFVLSDRSIGIISYHLQLNLDEYGQLLKVNWPKRRYNNKSSFVSRDEIEQFAIAKAKLRRFDTSYYEVYFRYNVTLDILSWQFMFPEFPALGKSGKRINKRYNVLEIDWKELRVVSRFQYEHIHVR